MEGYALNDPRLHRRRAGASSRAWVDELHALGYLAGVYGSAASTIRDLQALAATGSAPDDVWIADWNGQETVFGNPYVSDTLWTNHQRLHQYRGGHHETWGGVTIDVDSSYVDAAVVGSVTRRRRSPPSRRRRRPTRASPPPARSTRVRRDRERELARRRLHAVGGRLAHAGAPDRARRPASAAAATACSCRCSGP